MILVLLEALAFQPPISATAVHQDRTLQLELNDRRRHFFSLFDMCHIPQLDLF